MYALACATRDLVVEGTTCAIYIFWGNHKCAIYIRRPLVNVLSTLSAKITFIQQKIRKKSAHAILLFLSHTSI
jgi:hypothetical protein